MTANVRQMELKKPGTTPAGLLATWCKAASDPLRLDIMRVLSRDTFGVQELAYIFSMPQPGMSHHLKVLTKAGLLVARRQGNSVFYRRALLRSDGELNAFQASLYAAIDELPLATEYHAKIERIYAERAARSRSYFERHASKFAENQGMLCDLGQYLANVQEFLDLMALPRPSRVLEVGPGQGLLLQELATRFNTLVALDNSGEMLALAQDNAALAGKVAFVQSSIEDYAAEQVMRAAAGQDAEIFDAVILNMVLHHLSSPAGALKKLRSIVRPQGYLLIADLGLHNQEWTRESCGDLWLGFDPQDLTDWASQAGFAESHGSYLGLKNGFQIQLRLFQAI